MDDNLQKNIKRLHDVPLFREVPPEILSELAAKARAVTFEKDQVLFHKGDPGDALYVISSGWVKVVTNDAKGDELVLNHCGPGETIGDVSLIDGENRSAGVVALVPVKMLMIQRQDFLDVLGHHPLMALGIMGGLSAKIRLSTTYIEKAIEWSHRVANGDYGFAEQIDAEHKTLVTMSHSDEARVGEFLSAFFRLVESVRQREDSLKKQLVELTIQIDEVRKQKDVENLTQSDFFQRLKAKSKSLRRQNQDDEG